MSSKGAPGWFPTEEELSQTRALLAELEEAERIVRQAQAVQTRVSAALMRIAVGQGRRAAHARLTGAAGVRGGADDMPVRSLAAEVALVRGVSRFRAKNDLADAYLLHEAYPATLALVEAGTIGQEHARAVTDNGNRLRDDLRAVYEERVRGLLDETPTQSVSGFAAECRRVAEQLDPHDSEEKAAVERRRRTVFTTVVSEHLAELHVIGEAATIHGMEDRITSIARTVRRDADRARRDAVDAAAESDPGVDPDPRTLGEVCADVAADLVLTGAPTAHNVTDASGRNVLDAIRGSVQVTIPVQTLTGLQDDAGYLTGHGPLPADTARLLAEAAPAWERLFRDPDTGALLTVDSYTPTAAQRRFLRARDEHCRFPGCDRAFHRSDIDHTVAWADGGTTTVTNLGALCRHHHTLRHHSPWKVRHIAAGVYEWTSATGRNYRERPAPSVRFVDSEQLAHGYVIADDLVGEPAPF